VDRVVTVVVCGREEELCKLRINIYLSTSDL
jgi:hypothetical protein